MIIGSIDLLLAPCATRVRNCGAKPTVVRHQSLPSFLSRLSPVSVHGDQYL